MNLLEISEEKVKNFWFYDSDHSYPFAWRKVIRLPGEDWWTILRHMHWLRSEYGHAIAIEKFKEAE